MKEVNRRLVMMRLTKVRWAVMFAVLALASLAAAQTTEEELASARKERDELKEKNKALSTELEVRKGIEATFSNTLADIHAHLTATPAVTNYARPVRIPEDVRYLCDFVRAEKVRVVNGSVYPLKMPVVNALAPLFMAGPLVGTEAGTAKSIDEKLTELEHCAGITNDAVATKDRIGKLYESLQVPDWQFERLRFGATAFYNKELEGLGAAITLRAYPAYSRYMDGRFDNFEDGIWRRLSFQVGVGGMLSRDDEKADSTGLVGNVGLGWDIVYGVTLFAGESFYTYSKPGVDGDETDHDTVFGVTLNAEFWEALMGKR